MVTEKRRASQCFVSKANWLHFVWSFCVPGGTFHTHTHNFVNAESLQKFTKQSERVVGAVKHRHHLCLRKFPEQQIPGGWGKMLGK